MAGCLSSLQAVSFVPFLSSALDFFALSKASGYTACVTSSIAYLIIDKDSIEMRMYRGSVACIALKPLRSNSTLAFHSEQQDQLPSDGKHVSHTCLIHRCGIYMSRPAPIDFHRAYQGR